MKLLKGEKRVKTLACVSQRSSFPSAELCNAQLSIKKDGEIKLKNQ